MLIWPSKDSDEITIRYVDWSRHDGWIAGDSILSATFTLTTAAGMTPTLPDHDGNMHSLVTLSGGTTGSKGKALCQVTTDEGQTLQQTATILIRAR